MLGSPFRVFVLAAVLGATAACSDDEGEQPGSSGATGASSSGSGGSGGAAPAGALVRVSVDGEVGVLLGDLPDALRDRAARAIIAEPASFWQERAKRQIAFTHFRLTFRRYYYLTGDRKQLPLPPVEALLVELDPAGAKRTTIDGHDAVTIGYTLGGTLVSDPDSPAESEPALAEVGGSWDETLVLPLDPEMVFQRTGYACMRETENPPNSVDSENAQTFYDPDCLATASGVLNCHVTVPSWPESCDEALAGKVGRRKTTLHFERLPYDASVAGAARVGALTSDTPDLAVVAAGLENRRLVYRWIPADSCAIAEGCVGGSGWRRLLQFDADVHNVGKTPLHIGEVKDSPLSEHNVYEYSPCHKHMHFRFYGDFHYGPALGGKRAFCLLSTTRLSNDESTPLVSPYDGCDVQGIAAGWGDEYFAGLDCQWIDVTDVDTSTGPVTEQLTFLSNPNQFLCEGTPVLDADGNPTFEPTEFTTESGDPIDRPRCEFADGWDANNVGSTAVTLPPQGSFVTAPCTRGQLGPLRDCGFAEQPDAFACTAGQTVTLSCAIADAAQPQMLRICETSTVLGAGVACTYRDALASGVAGDTAVQLTFTCPGPRDPTEPGGDFALYGAPVFEDDDPVSISCAQVSP